MLWISCEKVVVRTVCRIASSGSLLRKLPAEMDLCRCYGSLPDHVGVFLLVTQLNLVCSGKPSIVCKGDLASFNMELQGFGFRGKK